MKDLLLFQKLLSDTGAVKILTIIADGEFHRFGVKGDKHGQMSGWYILNDHGDLLVGACGNWRTGLSEVWCSKSVQTLSGVERKAYAESIAKAKQQYAEAKAKMHQEVKIRAQKLILSTRDATTDNAYAKRKCIRTYGCKVLGYTDTLVVPICDGDDEQGQPYIVNIQFISPDGSKKYMTGGKKKGCYLQISKNDSNIYVICEGFATGASIAQATNYQVIVAFDAGNLLPVAQHIAKSKKPDQTIIIAADNDTWGEVNIGVQKASEAAKAIHACLAIPDFANCDASQKPTDFNDLHQLAGLEEVARQINAALNQPPPTSQPLVQSPIDERQHHTASTQGVDIISLDQVKMEPIAWLIKNWLPLGKLTLLAGQAGTGKTQLAISIAAKLSAGKHLPDGSVNPPFSILMWSGEDDISTVITPRFKASMAQMNRIHLVQGVTELNGQSRPFDFASDLPDLKAKAVQIGDIGLIIIDPIVSVVAGDSNKSSDVRAGLQPIVDMAQELNCAVIGITHYRKSSNAQNISDDVLGSQAYIAVPRVAWGTKRRDSDNTCVVAIIKNNLAPLIGGYEYTIESHTVLNDLGQEIETSRIVWGEYRTETASQLFKDFASDNADDTESLTEPSKLLIDLLKDGSSIKVSDIKRMVDEHPSISWRSVERAGTALKVVRQRTNTFPSETYWCLPPISPHLVKPNQACA